MIPEIDWYDTPLYYDIIFDEATLREAAFLEAAHELWGTNRPSMRVLEPACGSGRLVLELAKRGHEIWGFDGNPLTLEFAEKRLTQSRLSAKLWMDSMQAFQLPGPGRKKGTFDLAHCLVSSFKYLLEDEDVLQFFSGVSSALRVGGLFILGFHLTDYKRKTPEVEKWRSQRGPVIVDCTIKTKPADRRSRLEELSTTLTVTVRDKVKKQQTHWIFRTYNAGEVKRLLRQIPDFSLVACHDFTFDLFEPRKLDDAYPDIVLVLKKNGRSANQ